MCERDCSLEMVARWRGSGWFQAGRRCRNVECGGRFVPFGCREGAGAVVHCVVVLESRITYHFLSVVMRKPAVVKGGSGCVEECAVYALREAVFMWSIWDGAGLARVVPLVCLNSCGREVLVGIFRAYYSGLVSRLIFDRREYVVQALWCLRAVWLEVGYQVPRVGAENDQDIFSALPGEDEIGPHMLLLSEKPVG